MMMASELNDRAKSGAYRDPFREACRSQEAAVAFLEPMIGELVSACRALRERWSELMAARAAYSHPAPGRTFTLSERAEFLGAWQDNGMAVSLDIFDTCLVRFLATPVEFFALLGERVKPLTRLEAAAFSSLRMEVEGELRRHGLETGTREDTLFPAIYDALAQRLSWDPATREEVLMAELTLERFLLRPVRTVRERAWRLHRKDLLAAYTSEMYLPADTLRWLLQENGFPVDGVQIFSSGETGLSKGTGNLYRHLLKQFPGRQILHVGDNPVSDGAVPAGLGLAAGVISTRKQVYPDRLSNLLHAAADHEPVPGPSFWESFGFRIAGPVHFAFAAFVYRRCAELHRKSLYFLSRDGWFPIGVFGQIQEAWGGRTDARYLYASREFLGLGSMTSIEAEEWDFLLRASPLLRPRDVLERIGLVGPAVKAACSRHGLGDPDRLLCHHWGYRDPRDRDRLYAAICDNLPAFLHHKEQVRASLLAYCREMGVFVQPSLFVDMGWGASSLKALAAIAPAADLLPHGLYFGLLGGAPQGASSYFTDGAAAPARISLLKGSIALMEFLSGSPEPSVRTMARTEDGWRPVFRRSWPDYDRDAWAGIGRGIQRFTGTVLQAASGPPEGDGSAFVEDTLRRLLFEPSHDELDLLGPLVHAEGWGTENRLRLLPRMDRLSSPEALHEAMCYAPWKPGLLAQAKRHGIRTM